MKTSKITVYLLIYGFTHMLVDASSIYLMLGLIDVRDELPFFILLYNLLAFGLQLPLGWLLDRIGKPVMTAIFGCLLLAASLISFKNPLLATLIAGTGNALFHVGGGTISLNLIPGKAAMPGVFVAPGGIGLVLGALFSKFIQLNPLLFILLLLSMAAGLYLLKRPILNYKQEKAGHTNYTLLVIVLLLVAICIRSVLGLSYNFPWKSQLTLLLILTLSIAFGKGLGGFLADWFGWIRITVGGLCFSAILLLFGSAVPFFGIVGMFMFNMTMPVTLVAISNLLPGRPGFSFGLTTFALMFGSVTNYLNMGTFFSGWLVSGALIMLCAILIYMGLKKYFVIMEQDYLK